jgi:hypothetical protein
MPLCFVTPDPCPSVSGLKGWYGFVATRYNLGILKLHYLVVSGAEVRAQNHNKPRKTIKSITAEFAVKGNVSWIIVGVIIGGNFAKSLTLSAT